MLNIVVISTILLTSILFYKKRFTSELKIGDIYLVQLYYWIAGTIVCLFFINTELDIVSRPAIEVTPFSSNLLQNIFIASIVVAAMGNAIHSTSTSVTQAFTKDKHKGHGYQMNRKFHQAFSHNLVYVGAILAQIALALLELNHPLTTSTFPIMWLILGGVILGGIESLAILWGSHIGFSLIASIGGAYLVNFFLHHSVPNIAQTPITILIVSALITMSICLALTSLIFLVSENWTRLIIRKTFPKGHSWQKELQAKILTFRVQKRILKEDHEVLAYQESTPYH